MGEEKEKNSLVQEFWEFLKTLLISVLIVFVLVHWVVRPIRVQGESMYPTLESKAVGFSNILGVQLTGIHRFDVVIIYVPQEKEYLVKRVIGLPGETIAYRNGILYVNGEEVQETFLNQEYTASYQKMSSTPFTADTEAITLADDEYYCLGDNRPYSRDSRFYGPFVRLQIKSRGTLILYPFSQFGVTTW